MRKQDIQELKLLEEVSRNGGLTTQRELARRLEISVGLVNAFIKRVVRKGYFKVRNMPGRRVRYLLTPQGLAEKSRLTLNYLQYSLAYYRDVRIRLQALVKELEVRGIRTVVLVGTDELAELFYLSLREAGIEIFAIASVNEGDSSFLGYPVLPLIGLKNGGYDAICVADLKRADRIRSLLDEVAVSTDGIFIAPAF